MGKLTAGVTSCFASPGALAPRILSAPTPPATPTPTAPATGMPQIHLEVHMRAPPQSSPEAGRERSGVCPRPTPIIPDPLVGDTRRFAVVTSRRPCSPRAAAPDVHRRLGAGRTGR